MRLRNVSVLTVLLFGLSGLVSLSWYTGRNRRRRSSHQEHLHLLWKERLVCDASHTGR
uniref:Uncharacterized protein n=1 Tax=Poecilia latipinna TaxID=48699 RepID=A0A3B3UKR9_9TELE